MRLSYFISFILLLTIGWMQFYSSIREVYNGVEEYQFEVDQLEAALEQARIERELEREHFLDFRQNVATLMPEVLKKRGKGEQGYSVRNLASVVSRTEREQVRRTIAKTLFEKGKQHFRKKEYDQAIRAFRQLVDRFSYSPYTVEALFLLAESHFQANELESSTSVVETMVELFPSHELTGFAMIRLGRIYEIQSRSEEAIDIYRTVLRSFPQRDVAAQARSSLRGLEL